MSSVSALLKPHLCSVFDLSELEYSVLVSLQHKARTSRSISRAAATTLLRRHLAIGWRGGKLLRITYAGIALIEAIECLEHAPPRRQTEPGRLLAFPVNIKP